MLELTFKRESSLQDVSHNEKQRIASLVKEALLRGQKVSARIDTDWDDLPQGSVVPVALDEDGYNIPKAGFCVSWKGGGFYGPHTILIDGDENLLLKQAEERENKVLKIGPVITGAEFPREFWGKFHDPKSILQTQPIPAELTYVDLLWGDHVNNGGAPFTEKSQMRGWIGCYASLNGYEYRNYKWDGDALMLSWNSNTNNEQIIVFFSDDPYFGNLQVIPRIKGVDDPYTYTEDENMVVECNFHCLGPDSAAIGRKAILDVLRYAEAFAKHAPTREAFGTFADMLGWAKYFKDDDMLHYIARALEEAGYPMPWGDDVSPAAEG